MVEPNEFGVLLIRKRPAAIDGSFAYVSDRLPALGERIQVTTHYGTPVQATVTGLEPSKSRPIRATED